ncbi:MAG: sulfite exporter TauE/SafE family protein [SAR324 cluster bacterium]|nr:sulfite exporter TauE/SafE family protein [SAR324 cluster bacterium]
MDFSFEVLIFIAVVFLLAAFIHGSIGFGFPMVTTPLLALFTDIQTAIVLTLIPTLLVNIISIISEGNILVAVRRHFLLALLAMLGSAVGTQILLTVNSDIFKVLLGVVIIIYLFAEKIKLKLSWIREHPKFSKFIFGLSAGIIGGLTNVMAPVLIIYSLESKYSKSDTVQASNLCFLLGKIIQIVLFIINGKFSLNEFSTSSAMFIVTSIALYGGIAVRNKIKGKAYQKILRFLLFLLAIILLIQVSI